MVSFKHPLHIIYNSNASTISHSGYKNNFYVIDQQRVVHNCELKGKWFLVFKVLRKVWEPWSACVFSPLSLCRKTFWGTSPAALDIQSDIFCSSLLAKQPSWVRLDAEQLSTSIFQVLLQNLSMFRLVVLPCWTTILSQVFEIFPRIRFCPSCPLLWYFFLSLQ